MTIATPAGVGNAEIVTAERARLQAFRTFPCISSRSSVSQRTVHDYGMSNREPESSLCVKTPDGANQLLRDGRSSTTAPYGAL